MFWVKYHSFSANNYENLVSVSIVIVLQKGCGPIAQWRNAARTFSIPFFAFILFLPLYYFWGRQFLPPLELFTPYFFLPTVHYCIKTLRLWFCLCLLFLGPTIIFVPRAFLPPYFLSTDSAIRIFCFHLLFFSGLTILPPLPAFYPHIFSSTDRPLYRE